MAAALQGREEGRILVNDDAMEERARRVLAAAGTDPDAGVCFFEIPTDDAWIRDTGPVCRCL